LNSQREDEKDIPDELSQNYQKMDEFGKEELLKETERILKAHNPGKGKFRVNYGGICPP
jgi:vacuolar-type H+-ATPase subunit H